MNRISQEAEAALNAKTWNEQREFIEHVEELLMDEDDSITVDEIQICFNVFSKYVTDDNKNLVQRSMKIVEALCQSYKDTSATKSEAPNGAQLQNVSQIFKSVFQCLNDNRPNIREQSVRTLQSLINISGFTIFCQNTLEQASSFSSEGRTEVIQLLKLHQDDMTELEWKLIFNFLIQSYEDKVPAIKSKAQELYKHEMFLSQLQLNINRLNPSQKKVFQALLDKQASSSAVGSGGAENGNGNLEGVIGKQNDESMLDDGDSKGNRKVVIDLNTSAFSRKQRQSELKDSDGLFLLTDVSTFGPFMHRLSLDIRDVFDDELSELLLSQQSFVRVSAVDRLREIFNGSMKNFEYSADIIIRWCLFQFLGWQLNISQASLSLLTDMFDQCINSEKFSLTSKEVHIITPIVLWCMTTESDAFKYLLQQVRHLSKEKDYNESLLMSLSLDHIPVITHIFDELKQCRNIECIRGQLEELNLESTTSFVRDECKKLLQKIAPLSPRRAQSMNEPVKRLQVYITQIKTNPDGIEDCREIFGYILDMFDRKTKDSREIRYLLYCTHAFLSEPVLVCQVNMNDFSTLVISLCEFSLECPLEFFDALISIGFVIASVHVDVSIFDALINFLTKHYDTQNRRSFCYQMFTIGVQLMAVNQNSNDLQQFRSFAKSVIGQFPSKDDLRAVLCRTLLSEILLIENQKKSEAELLKNIEDGSFIQFRQNNNNLSVTNNASMMNASELDSTQNVSTVIRDNGGDDLFELLRILKRLTRQETRFESIRDLIAFDERYPGEKIVETIVKLSPLLGKHIESIRNRSNNNSNSRPSSRSSSRGEDELNRSFGSSGKNSRPSSRNSQRQSSVGHDQPNSSSRSRISSSSSNRQQALKNSSKISNVRNKYQSNW